MKMLLRSDRRVRRRHFDLLDLGFLQALGFGSSILEPDFDLGFGERERVGELGPFRDGEILLGVEFSLQREQLLSREGSSRLTVGFVLPEVASGGGDAECCGRGFVCNARKENEIIILPAYTLQYDIGQAKSRSVRPPIS